MPSISSQSILIVEDDPAVRSLLEDTLSDAGYEVVSAASVLRAEFLSAIHRPCIVVLDWRLVDGDGGNVVEQVRDELPKDAAIILISGEPDLPRLAHEVGAAAWLPKPFDVRALLQEVERLSGHRQA